MTAPEEVGANGPPRGNLSFPMRNNFDLLRLVAALQVVYFHIQFHMRTDMGALATPLRWVLGPLTGVPIFFVISGFLVSASFERNPDYRIYARKRIVRIFPALWVCLAVTVAVLAGAGQLGDVAFTPKFAVWLVAQLSLGQALHLAAFRDFATGIPNASLWTISVEVLFYATVPVLYRLIVRRGRRQTETARLIVLGVASFMLATVLVSRDPEALRAGTTALNLTPLPYLYLFLIGILCQRNFDRIARWTVGQALWWIGGYYLLVGLIPTRRCTVALGWCPPQAGFRHAPIFLFSQLVLGGAVIAVAFSGRSLSERLLRGNDVSYGTYLFHMLIVNVAVAAGITGHGWLTPVIIVASVVAGWLSWQVVERPAVRRWRGRTVSRSTLPLAATE